MFFTKERNVSIHNLLAHFLQKIKSPGLKSIRSIESSIRVGLFIFQFTKKKNGYIYIQSQGRLRFLFHLSISTVFWTDVPNVAGKTFADRFWGGLWPKIVETVLHRYPNRLLCSLNRRNYLSLLQYI